MPLPLDNIYLTQTELEIVYKSVCLDAHGEPPEDFAVVMYSFQFTAILPEAQAGLTHKALATRARMIQHRASR